ncbi:uncharacterized protein LOC126880212 [Diabrotica virgifera virgifera]|uniref:THAP9-like helix-turn-helix domain-containing protein n=1 Tax=Diabrotica virgifera virgifera TaxID=50390 RepID=A0ABM5JPU3_DIAVI|nr:uncharacterized protein LOC126880212 [Diabrotica virgifera virgifera]
MIEMKTQKAIVEELLEVYSHERIIDVSDVPSTSNESEEDILKRKYEELLKENKKLKEKLEENEQDLYTTRTRIVELNKRIKEKDIDSEKNILKRLGHMFSKNEIEIILKKKTRACWTTEEISKAFTIRYFSRRCYLYLRNTLKYPLPGISTLQNRAAHINLRSGLLQDVLQVMYVAGKSKTEL